MTMTRPPIYRGVVRHPVYGDRPPLPSHRWAWRLALGVVIALNALIAICWPAVVELIASYV